MRETNQSLKKSLIMITEKQILDYCNENNIKVLYSKYYYDDMINKGLADATEDDRFDEAIGFEMPKTHTYIWFEYSKYSVDVNGDRQIHFDHFYNSNNGVTQKGWRRYSNWYWKTFDNE